MKYDDSSLFLNLLYFVRINIWLKDFCYTIFKVSISMETKDSFLKTDQNLCLQWKNISLIDKKTDKHVLDHLSGQVKSGQFLTIMGPSGAGKSSFLSVITSKLSSYSGNFRVKGRTSLNGHKYSEEQFISIASYVPQDDLLLETLTVKQTLDFQAKLKLPYSSQLERQQRVEQVLKILNLYEIRDSYVGGRQKKSISGGQKKRVVVGVQLISNPLCLVLDEPTSGLDSFNSLKIIKILSNLAKNQNKLIIATIHQPSTLMFQNFDRLMILKNGRQVYNQQASKIVSYMQDLRIKVDQRMNPADFFMLQLSSYKQMQGHVTRMTCEAFQGYSESESGLEKSMVGHQMQKINFDHNAPTPLNCQFKPLLVRNFKNFLRTPSNQFGRLMQMICYPLFIGSIYYDVITQMPDISDPQNLQTFLTQFAAFIFLGLFFTLGQTIYDTMMVYQVPTQKQLIMKQVHSNMYSLNVYYITKLLIQLPGMLIPIWIATSIVYFVVGLQNRLEYWLLYQLVFTFQAIAGYFVGIIAGIICKQQHFAIQASPFIVIPLVIYGGLIVNLKTLPVYSSWVQYITPIKYGFNVLMRDQLSTEQLHHLGDILSVRDKLGLSGTIEQNITQLVLLTFGFFVFSFVVLYVRRKFN